MLLDCLFFSVYSAESVHLMFGKKLFGNTLNKILQTVLYICSCGCRKGKHFTINYHVCASLFFYLKSKSFFS